MYSLYFHSIFSYCFAVILMTNYFFGGVAIVTAVDLFFLGVVEDIKSVWNPRTRPN